MQDKIEILLKQINLEKSHYEYFINAKLNRIVANKKMDSYNFIIENENTLPLNIYLIFKDNLEKSFKTVKKVSVIFKCINKNNIQEYYNYFLNELSKESPLLKMFENKQINISNNQILFEVGNIAEQNKFNSIKEILEKNLTKAGFDCSFNIVINKEINKEITEEISKPKQMVIKEEVKQETKVEKPKYERKDKTKSDNPEVIYGRMINTDVVTIDNVLVAQNSIVVEGYIFDDIDVRNTKTDLKILTLKITDYTDSIYAKMFINSEDELLSVLKDVKKGNWIKIRGNVKDDAYTKELVLMISDINKLEKILWEETELEEEKRVELHTHTKMSQMDGICDVKSLIKKAKKWGHKAIAITDHNGAQSFPDAYHLVCDLNKGVEEKDKFKVIYGTELTMIDDTVNIVIRPNDSKLLENTYVIFDFETTGFNAAGKDSIIEIGAVKIKDGEVLDTFNELVNPGRNLPAKITELTGITDNDLIDKDNEENAVKRFIEWFGDFPMVAHNAKFDLSFLQMAYKKYNLGEYTNTLIDTLELSRTLDNNFARHSLSALVKRYNVSFDEDSHHRADYDALGTGLVFHKMLKKLDERNFETINDLNNLVSKDEIHKYGRSYHVNLLVQNKVGLKNLFKIISLASTKYLYKTPRILRSEIQNLREGILVGSGCYESEVFIEARSKADDELTNIMSFYDYIEVQPLECYDHLLQSGDFGSKYELTEHVKKIVKIGKETGIIVVATGDVHHIEKDEKIFREIIVNQKVPGGGRHPLARKNITSIPSNHFRTTQNMLECFEFLDEETRKEIVVLNTNKIADSIEIVEVIIETYGVPFSPKIENSQQIVTDLVYDKAFSLYGNPLPFNIEERIAKELYGDSIINILKEKYPDDFSSELNKTIRNGYESVKNVIKEKLIADNVEDVEKQLTKNLGGIIGGGFDVIYLISQKLVKKSNDDGYIVGSRGSVGSSFVATMMGITEVNPLPSHYVCSQCHHSIFEIDGVPLSNTYLSGFDLPSKTCPQCHADMKKEGNDMPFATFLGFNADKVPDIDLNFSDLNQAAAHDYTKVLFGEDNVYRAGTIGTVADKTAFGFVKGYCEEKNISKRTAEIERLAKGCTGVKRTTGQHPGGIVVVPDYMDVSDFTPFQFPADDVKSAWRTTHFDYHAIDQDLLKLDILGHSDPTQLRLIQDLSGQNVTDVPLDDKKTMDIFLSPEPLNVTKEQIMCETGTLGIPEFGTNFTIALVNETKPTTFAELIKISGLSHGTDVWVGNAQELIKNKVVEFKEVIGCRDDIMVYLMFKGMKPIKAFKIMEFVRKGRASKDPAAWVEFAAEMKEAGIEEWYIESCRKIKYMFPKAHATAYVMSAFRIAYYKVHYPQYFYASWLSTKAVDFDIETMIKGYEPIKEKIKEIINKGYEATNKENAVLECLKLALEMTARGLKFANIDLMNSDSHTFKVLDEKTILPPFSTIEGLGDTVANNIIIEREKGNFISIEDLQKRAKISTTVLDKMRSMGILKGMDESNQLTLF